MGEIVSFRSSRNVRAFRKKQSVLAYRNKPERWRPIDERTRIVPANSTPAIQYAIEAFRMSLEKLEKKGLLSLSDGEDWDLMRKAEYRLLSENILEIELLPKEIKAAIVLKMCRRIHDGWVYDYYQDFFNYFLDWEFVYLPLELIGVDQLFAIYEPLEKALTRLGLGEVDFETVVGLYDKWRAKFLKKYRINRPAELISAIAKIADEYSALRQEVREVLEERAFAFDVARQVTRYSAEMFR